MPISVGWNCYEIMDTDGSDENIEDIKHRAGESE